MTLCSGCPRKCNADRQAGEGWCCSDDRIRVASVVLHRGEEPPLSGEKGIVNLFFPSCNMKCIYCQNYQISSRGYEGVLMTTDEVCDAICQLLPLSEGNLGFVSPTHFVPQMVSIVRALWSRGHHPVIVYNSNGYDLPEVIRSLEGIVDVWLPDFRYSDDRLAEELSGAPGYSAYALASLKEMVHQCGVTVQLNDRGIAQRGVIVRHLVLPGAKENSIGVLRTIAEEVSPGVSISLMSQYYPPYDNPQFSRAVSAAEGVDGAGSVTAALGRTVTVSEYQTVVDAFTSLGFTKGWLQEPDSSQHYRPDFSNENPFGCSHNTSTNRDYFS